jgi:putative glutathione S-transferase
MGKLIEGQWRENGYGVAHNKGRFVRKPTTFRRWVEDREGAEFKAEAERYHLYVSYACPWAHRTLIFRALKGLDKVIGASVVDPLMLEGGWKFTEERPDHLGRRQFLHQVYADADPTFTGRVTVPVLWDKKTETIVNNESSEIIRMFNSEFSRWASDDYDYYPEEHRAEIDALNERIYETVNNGVYKAGFAGTQEAHEEAIDALFETLDFLEDQLSDRSFLVGDVLTEADWRLFTTLVRFDPVYEVHFKCNLRRLADYPNLWDYTRRLYLIPGVAETTNMDDIKRHYYISHRSLNPKQIVPKGPAIDVTTAQ